MSYTMVIFSFRIGMWFEWLGIPRNRCWKTRNTTKGHVPSQVSQSHTSSPTFRATTSHERFQSGISLPPIFVSLVLLHIIFFGSFIYVSPSSVVHQIRFLLCLSVHTQSHTNLLLHLRELQNKYTTYDSFPSILTALPSHTLHMLTRPKFTGISSDLHITLFCLILHKGTQSQCPFTPTRPEKATWNEAALALCQLACCIHYVMSNCRWKFPVSWPRKQHSELKIESHAETTYFWLAKS